VGVVTEKSRSFTGQSWKLFIKTLEGVANPKKSCTTETFFGPEKILHCRKVFPGPKGHMRLTFEEEGVLSVTERGVV